MLCKEGTIVDELPYLEIINRYMEWLKLENQ